MIEAPFAQSAYLWKSIDMLVTPGTVKSKSVTSAPISRQSGSRNPPMQPSTWNSTSRSAATAPISRIGSTEPCGNEQADATTRIV